MIPNSKNGQTRHIPLNDRALEIFSEFYQKRTSDWVFPSRSLDRPMDTHNFIARVFMPALKKAAVTGFCWHCLRHSFASALAMSGTPLHTIQVLMGHSNMAMSMRYSHLAPSHLKEAINRLVKPKQ